MNLTIFTGPDPGANLMELLKRTPLGSGPVCAVVPDFYSVREMERQLAELSGDAFLGHRVLTFEGLALSILSNAGQVQELIGEYTKRALLGEIIRSRVGEHSPYYDISGYPGFLSQLVSYLREIRSLHNGAGKEDGSELASIAAAYELHLRRLGVTDHEGLVILALEDDRAEQFSSQFRGSLIVDGFYDLTECQFELLSQLFERFTRSAVTLLNDPVRHSLFALPKRLLKLYQKIEAKVVFVEKESSDTPGRVLSGFMGEEYHGSGFSGDVQIHTFRDEYSEADWICGTARSLVSEGVCEPGDVMIVSRAQPGFGSPVHTALGQHGLPLERVIERPLIQHSLILLVLDAIEASITADETLITRVRESCYTGRLSLSGSLPVESMDDRGWSCMIAENDTPEGFVTSLKNMFEHLRIKDNIDGGGDRNLMLYEIMVYERLISLLDEFVVLYTPFRRMMRAAEFHSLVRQFFESVTAPEMRPPCRGVLVVGAMQARYIRRKVVFVTGLDNESFPLKPDPFTLHGSQRAGMIREHHEREEGLLFYLAGTGAERLFFTFPGLDDEDKESSMSPYLEEIREGISSWCQPEFHHGVPGAAWQGGAVSERGRAENLMRLLKSDLSKSPSLLAGIRQMDVSLEKQLRTAIAGCIERVKRGDLNLAENTSREQILHGWGHDRIFSVTELEQYLFCPVGFFLSRVLGLKVERYEEDEINPADMGILIHGILAEFYKRRLQHGGRTSFSRGDLNECRLLIKDIIEQAITGELITARRFHPVILIAEKKLMLAWMEAFLDNEAGYFEETRFEPSFFEIEFGSAKRKSSADYPPLTVESGDERVLVGGRIDRIDNERRGDSCLVRIIDYKTGSVNAPIRELEEGAVLQIPLYLKAAVEYIVPDGVLYDGVYYSLRDMEMKVYKEKSAAIMGESWENYIKTACKSACTVASEIRKGHFPVGAECEDYCEFKALCRGARLGTEQPSNADS